MIWYCNLAVYLINTVKGFTQEHREVIMRKIKFDMTWGRMNYYRKAKSIIDELENELKISNNELIHRYYILGQIDGISEGQDMSHKNTIDSIVVLKKEISELQKDYELFKYEIEYNKGFFKGLERILDLNREYFKNHTPLLFIIYFEDDLLMKKYKAAIRFTELMEYNANKNYKDMYYFSDDIDEITEIISNNKNKNYELSVSVVAYDKNSCIFDKLLCLSKIEPENIFLIYDKDTINVKKMIDKILNYHVLS